MNKHAESKDIKGSPKKGSAPSGTHAVVKGDSDSGFKAGTCKQPRRERRGG
jgi:hypothetical protein